MKAQKRIKFLEEDVDLLFDIIHAQHKWIKSMSKLVKANNKYASVRMDLIEYKHQNSIK